MILMGMGQHEAEEIGAILHDEGRVRHDDVDARRRLIAEGDAEIDHQPFAVMAVETEIHPDLAAAAERQEQQLVGAGTIGHGRFSAQPGSTPVTWISTSPFMVISGSRWAMTGVAPTKSGASPPVAMVVKGAPNSLAIRDTSPSISPT